jgi:hypothetical protein
MSPTERTLKALRERGQICGMVERFNRFGGKFGIRQDLFGILDIIALDFEKGVVGVQSTGTDFAGHWKKLTEEKAKESHDWLMTPGTSLELWGWRKIKKVRGGKATVYAPRIRAITIDDLKLF